MLRKKHPEKAAEQQAKKVKQVFLHIDVTGFRFNSKDSKDKDYGDNILKIDAISYTNGKRDTEEFHFLLNPNHEISANATKATGIKQKDVKDCPTFADIHDKLLTLIKGAELVVERSWVKSFLNHELHKLDENDNIEKHCKKLTYLSKLNQELNKEDKVLSLKDICAKLKIKFPCKVKKEEAIAKAYQAMHTMLGDTPTIAETTTAAPALDMLAKVAAKEAAKADTMLAKKPIVTKAVKKPVHIEEATVVVEAAMPAKKAAVKHAKKSVHIEETAVVAEAAIPAKKAATKHGKKPAHIEEPTVVTAASKHTKKALVSKAGMFAKKAVIPAPVLSPMHTRLRSAHMGK